MATILDVINGISQALSKNYDGALDEEGEPIKSGLKREEGNPLTDSRVIDGFKARVQGDKLILTYQLDTKIKEVHGSTFETDIQSTMSDLVKHLKKEYRKATGSSLTLRKEGETDIFVQYLSKVRTTVIATETFKLSEGLLEEEGETGLRDTFKKFLELGGNAKRPQNDKSKADNYKQFDPFNMTTGQRNSDLK
tara:strand:+ start:217 stop:798 length:582 start_codon:yes stop_codon:yes gene_type:complete